MNSFPGLDVYDFENIQLLIMGSSRHFGFHELRYLAVLAAGQAAPKERRPGRLNMKLSSTGAQ